MLNREGLISARGCAFKGNNVHRLRTGWGIPTVKINGVSANPLRWPDGTYSVQGAAEVLKITAQTVFKWLKTGRLTGAQLTKGQPWKIRILDEQIPELRVQVRRTSQSRKEAL